MIGKIGSIVAVLCAVALAACGPAASGARVEASVPQLRGAPVLLPYEAEAAGGALADSIAVEEFGGAGGGEAVPDGGSAEDLLMKRRKKKKGKGKWACNTKPKKGKKRRIPCCSRCWRGECRIPNTRIIRTCTVSTAGEPPKNGTGAAGAGGAADAIAATLPWPREYGAGDGDAGDDLDADYLEYLFLEG